MSMLPVDPQFSPALAIFQSNEASPPIDSHHPRHPLPRKERFRRTCLKPGVEPQKM